MVNPAVLVEGQAPAGRAHGHGINRFVAIGARPVGVGDDAGDFALRRLAVKNLQYGFLHQQRGQIHLGLRPVWVGIAGSGQRQVEGKQFGQAFLQGKFGHGEGGLRHARDVADKT
ncbi:hypothetical protein Xkoz_01004 [Xenorhabdus kozodoii]|uniref:Uncharacterized protein n=1 Tax=Xenorhabdus kozodoii TaxID=351676 RepID=A0A2D0LFL8_9GAMM|nr:hypothetical protein Xkoz_01004 [Xenorhabdus kozodoii]